MSTLRDVKVINDEINAEWTPPLYNKRQREDEFKVTAKKRRELPSCGIVPIKETSTTLAAMRWLLDSAKAKTDTGQTWPFYLNKELASPLDVWFEIKALFNEAQSPASVLYFKEFTATTNTTVTLRDDDVQLCWKYSDRMEDETTTPTKEHWDDPTTHYVFKASPVNVYKRVGRSSYVLAAKAMQRDAPDISYAVYSDGRRLYKKDFDRVNYRELLKSSSKTPLLFQMLCSIGGGLRPYCRDLSLKLSDVFPGPKEISRLESETLPSSFALKSLYEKKIRDFDVSLLNSVDTGIVKSAFSDVINGDTSDLATAESYFSSDYDHSELERWIDLLDSIIKIVTQHPKFTSNTSRYLCELFKFSFDAAVRWANRLRACVVYMHGRNDSASCKEQNPIPELKDVTKTVNMAKRNSIHQMFHNVNQCVQGIRESNTEEMSPEDRHKMIGCMEQLSVGITGMLCNLRSQQSQTTSQYAMHADRDSLLNAIENLRREVHQKNAEYDRLLGIVNDIKSAPYELYGKPMICLPYDSYSRRDIGEVLDRLKHELERSYRS